MPIEILTTPLEFYILCLRSIGNKKKSNKYKIRPLVFISDV